MNLPDEVLPQAPPLETAAGSTSILNSNSLAADAIARAAAVRMMIFDVDGVMTDGSLYLNQEGEAFKCFNSLDGQGIKLLQAAGIKVGIVSARSSQIVLLRAAELGIQEVLQGVHNKAQAVQRLAQAAGLAPEALGFMGDDVIDLSAFRCVNFAASVPNAPEYVRARAQWVASLKGGQGAVRECCDFILRAQHVFDRLIHQFTDPPSVTRIPTP